VWPVELLLLLYFGYVVSYTLIFSVAGLFYKTPPAQPSAPTRKFRVLIPSYKEDSVILDVAKRALNQTYPATHYKVTVIADSLQPATLQALRQLPIEVVEVHFESSTKVKSLNTALASLPDDVEYAVILDADNIMAADFLANINSVVSPAIRVVQGQRKPKNQNNSLALLDGVSEAINNHIYRQGTASLGLSASINGSGIAFDYAVLKQKLSTMSSVGGFDRELEIMLLQDGIRVHYHKGAAVFDEKVSQTQAFQNQRKRWIYSQYFYLRKYFFLGLTELGKGNFTFFNSAVLRNIQLPRLINIGLLTLLTAGLFFVRNFLFFGYPVWALLFSLQVAAMLLAIPGEFFTPKLAAAVFELPLIFFRMFLLLFKLKGANKKFIHTPHGVTNQSESH
jgi:cellulose synthase/poly-beta-1,6-N-acetylglucosamine synthase-like glycosyltransferase